MTKKEQSIINTLKKLVDLRETYSRLKLGEIDINGLRNTTQWFYLELNDIVNELIKEVL